MLGVNHLAGHGANRRGPVDISYLGELPTTSDATSHTESSQSLGAEAPGRVILVMTMFVSSSSSETTTGVTIGGVSAPKLVETISGTNSLHVALWALHYPSGTTADIVASHSASSSMFFMCYWRMTGTRGITTVHASDTDNGTTSPSGSILTPARGGIVGLVGSFTGGTISSSGITEDYNASVDDLHISVCSDNKATESTVSFTGTTGDVRTRLLAASFAPR